MPTFKKKIFVDFLTSTLLCAPLVCTEHNALVKSTTKIFSKFVAFSENPNFNWSKLENVGTQYPHINDTHLWNWPCMILACGRLNTFDLWFFADSVQVRATIVCLEFIKKRNWCFTTVIDYDFYGWPSIMRFIGLCADNSHVCRNKKWRSHQFHEQLIMDFFIFKDFIIFLIHTLLSLCLFRLEGELPISLNFWEALILLIWRAFYLYFVMILYLLQAFKIPFQRNFKLL